MGREIPSRGGYALVTGGKARLGAAIARALALDGWRVVIHAHAPSPDADGLAREIGTRIVTGDLADADIATRLFAGEGFCSLLVNNASLFDYDDIDTLSPAAMDAHYAVNLRAPVLLAQALKKQLPAGQGGMVVNLLDQKVFNLNPDFLSYTISKTALESATRLLAMALAPDVRVCGVAPGLSLPSGKQTPEGFETAHAATPLGFGSTPGDIAQAVLFVVNTPSITGQTITVDGGQHMLKRSRDVMFSYGVGAEKTARD